MTPYEQGQHYALMKLGLSASAKGAVGASPMKMPGAPKAPSAPKPPQPWSAQNQMEPKMHETAWQGAQKELDVGASRMTAKVDQGQRPAALPTGST